MSFKTIRGRAGVLSLLSKKGLYIDIGGAEGRYELKKIKVKPHDDMFPCTLCRIYSL